MRIVHPTEQLPARPVTVVIYGEPGVGKTTTALTAEDPLLLDFDGGARRAGERAPTVPIVKWSDLGQIQPEEVADYRTIVIDTAGRAVEMLLEDIMDGDSKLRQRSGAPTLQAYGVLKSAFSQWLSGMHQLGKDVVLVAHSEEQTRGEQTVTRLNVSGASRNLIYQSADAMAEMTMRRTDRVMLFTPAEGRYAKDPIGLGTVFAAPNCLATCINAMHDKWGEVHPDAEAPKQITASWDVEQNPDESTDQWFTRRAMLMAEHKAPSFIRKELMDEAVSIGFVWDKKEKRFVFAD